MATITFKYVSGLTYSRSFAVIKLRGLDDPDQVQLWPNFQRKLADGSVIEVIKGFRRVFTATLGILNSSTDRKFIQSFLSHPQRAVLYTTNATINCSLANVEKFENQWLYNTNLMRFFEVELIENSIYTTWPVLVNPTTDADMYIKTKVEITGTEASPQTLTTNTAPLDVDDTGNPYPAISLVSYAPTVLITEHQDCLVNRVSDITQSGANISFTVAHSDVGNPFGDGKFYATIVIGIQAK